jgi:iron complex outermembrane receptor protein
MQAVTPMAGVTWRVRPTASLFANVATSFETPTTTELANRPDGGIGLNRQLDPQRGVTYEVGTKGVIGGRLFYDLSLFDVETEDELIPFEIPGSGGRRYFRNAGRTRRRGGELGITAAFGPVDVGAAVTRLVYTYEEFAVGTTVLDGKRVPGVSPTTGALFATLRRVFGFATVEVQHAARTPVDDANANYADSYVLWNARAGLTRFSALGIQPVVGVDNIFDRTYVANVVSNAARGRFYETGPGTRVYVGVTLSGGMARR